MRHGTSVPFIMAPLIAAVGLYFGNSVVKTINEKPTGFSNFTCLIAHQSTGKSQALNCVKKSIDQVELFNKVLPHLSQLTNIGSVDGLIEYLSLIPCMIGEIN